MRALLVIAGIGALGACGSDNPTEKAIFPADYAATYQEVRNCRPSIEHGAVTIRVLAAPSAVQPYRMHDGPFPTGAILLKEEYPSEDTACAGPIKQWTVMEKLDDGTAADLLDWHWQKVDAKRKPITIDDPACISCHRDCPDGYLHTCTTP